MRAVLSALSIGLWLWAGSCFAQTPALGPRLQDATIIGRGGTIIIRRLPVQTPGGIVYRDITINLQVDAAGALRVDAEGAKASLRVRRSALFATHDVTVGSISETATPPEVAVAFTPGLYRTESGGMVSVLREGNRLFAGFPTYSLSVVSGDSPFSAAEWYAGPLRTNPHRGMVSRAGITSDTYSYGVVSGSGGGHFDAGMLIGVTQDGRNLTVVSFHRRGCCTYASTPTSSITLTKIGR